MITETRRKRRSWLLVLLLIPFIAMLWPPFYNYLQPDFHWYPFLLLVPTSMGYHHCHHHGCSLLCRERSQ